MLNVELAVDLPPDLAKDATGIAHAAASMTNPEAHKFIIAWVKENRSENINGNSIYRMIWSIMKQKRKDSREAKKGQHHGA